MLACLSIGRHPVSRWGLLTFLPKLFMDVAGWKIKGAGFVAAALPLGVAFGALSGGSISDKVFGGKRGKLQDSGVLHADESGWRVDGQTHWLWCFTTPKATYYMIDRSRGSPALRHFFTHTLDGVFVTDSWAAYEPVSCAHQTASHSRTSTTRSIKSSTTGARRSRRSWRHHGMHSRNRVLPLGEH